MQKSTGLRCNFELYKIVEVTVVKESGRVVDSVGMLAHKKTEKL